MTSLEQIVGWRVSDKRHDSELWQFEYRVRPYLKNVPDALLEERYAALCRNIAALVSEMRDEVPAKVQVLSSWWWLRKRVHMLAEYARRGRNVPPSGEIIGTPTAAHLPPCVPRFPNACDFVVKYGEERWLRPIVEQGIVRIAPASTYGDERLEEARRDDELNKYHFQLGDQVAITTQDGRLIPVIGDMRYTVSLNTNYYVLCMSNEFDSRMYSWFAGSNGIPSNACVVIWAVNEFARRLEIAAAAQLAGWCFYHNPVGYYDPYEVGLNQHVSPGATKDFSYAYQREYRFLWLPPEGITTVDPLFLNLGSLTDIAGLFRPDGTFICGWSQPAPL